MNSTNPRLVAQQGVEAQQVLDNPAYQEAMKRLRESVVKTWEGSSVRDREGQLLTLQVMKLTRVFEGTLASMIRAGQMVEAHVDIDAARSDSAVRRTLRKVF